MPPSSPVAVRAGLVFAKRSRPIAAVTSLLANVLPSRSARYLSTRSAAAPLDEKHSPHCCRFLLACLVVVSAAC